MEIATWNVNSIRTRLEQVCQWLDDHPLDYLCLQETKVVDESFPRQPFLERGYQVYCAGQKSYNGVAILSRSPLEVEVGFQPLLPDSGSLDEQKRLIMGRIAPDVALVNVYIPNGSSVGSDKYVYKLTWLDALYAYIKALQHQGQTRLILCGDFNIAPEDRDIHDPSDRQNHIMASEPERQALAAIQDHGFLVDAFRHFTSETGHFSWWDYRQGSFRRNWGWRIDHHYISAALLENLVGCTIDVHPRRLPQPSDHAPVILSLNF